MAARRERCRRPDEHMAAAGAVFGVLLLRRRRHVLSAARYHGWLDDGRCDRFELRRRGLHHRNGATGVLQRQESLWLASAQATNQKRNDESHQLETTLLYNISADLEDDPRSVPYSTK